jgi:hypothetical protein
MAVGLVLPTLAAAWLYQALPQRWYDAEAEGADSQLGVVLQRLSKRWRRLAAAADRLLGRLLGAESGWCARAAITWYLLSNCWLLCVLSA